MTVWEGIHLIACPRGCGIKSHGVVQGVVYSVKSITDTGAVLQMLPDYCQPTAAPPRATGAAAPVLADEDSDDEGDTHGSTAITAHKPIDVSKAKQEVTVPLQDLPAVMRLTHAMCYYTCQGRTLEGNILLLDTDHPRFSRRALIVGLSRATHGKFVHVANSTEAEVFLGERRKVVRVKRVTPQ